jgi:hypothetical protein
MNEESYRRSGILKIQTLKSCTSVTVNGNGKSFNNSLTITLPAADTPNFRQKEIFYTIKIKYFLLTIPNQT